MTTWQTGVLLFLVGRLARFAKRNPISTPDVFRCGLYGSHDILEREIFFSSSKIDSWANVIGPA
ncbi:hypothetical protein [Streptomyces sp. NPDC058595]|uniref:hypothetical protein n=1 Tax=Streptomyces sp. NPDC058595 TaxID=3346550 RepID=UPI0036545FF1